MVHVAVKDGNYNAVMEDEATTEEDGTCSMYVSVGDYQIYCNGEECSNSWYSDNVELTLYKGTELVTSSDIEWTSQLGTYETGSSITTSALYLMSTTYIATYKEDGTTYKVSQVIKIDKEKPVINNVTYKNSTDSWVQSNTMYIDATDRNGSGIYGYALIDATGDCSATTYQSANSFTLTNNTYKVCVMDNVGNITESDEITVDNIDDLGPSISYDYEPKTWTTEVRLTFSASDTQSDVRGYAITTKNEQPTVYINANRTSEYTEWDGVETSLTETENATYYLWVVDNVGNVSSQSVEITNIDRVTPEGSISVVKSSSKTTVSSNTWSNEGLNFTITTNTCGISGCTIYYCVDTTNSCTPSSTVSSGSTITSYNTKTGTYYIRYYIVSGAGVSSSVASYTAKVDTTKPTASVSASSTSPSYNTLKVDVTVTGSDNESGVSSVCVQESNDSSKCTWYSGTSKTIQFTASDSYDGSSKTYYAFAKDNAGNISSVKSITYTVYKQCSNSNYQSSSTGSCSKTCGGGTQTTTVKDTLTGNTCSTNTSSCNTQICTKTFTYTGSIQTYTIETTGYYKIQAYGAKGGGTNAGNGGYVTGVFYLTSGTTLYIVVGGSGTHYGYNGGGIPGYSSRLLYSAGTGYGGGATHVATRTGLLSTLSSYTSSILLVAAGGGGEGESGSPGGAAGGSTGEHGYSFNTSGILESGGGGDGATTSSAGGGGGSWYLDDNGNWANYGNGDGGGFGYGGHGASDSAVDGYGGGGGAGYYGGGGGARFETSETNSYDAGGGGGSSYIASTWNSKTVTSKTNQQGCSYSITSSCCSSCNSDGKVIISSVS